MNANDFANVDLLCSVPVSELQTEEARQNFFIRVEQIKMDMLAKDKQFLDAIREAIRKHEQDA